MKKKKSRKPSYFETIASAVTKVSGGTPAFIMALAVVLVWLVTGPLFDYSDTWQLVINTGTTIVTFLMVFLIQRNQNKDSIAVHLKLNELIVAIETSSNRLIAVEEMSEEELKVLKKFYNRLAQLARDEMSVQESHSDLIANIKHDRKSKTHKSVSKVKP